MAEAQQHATAQGKGAKVAPTNLHIAGQDRLILWDTSVTPVVQELEFDVAVAVTGEDQGRAGISVFGGAINIGGAVKMTDSSTQYSRIRFKVPIMLPH